jgi:hypothetical protein
MDTNGNPIAAQTIRLEETLSADLTSPAVTGLCNNPEGHWNA